MLFRQTNTHKCIYSGSGPARGTRRTGLKFGYLFDFLVLAHQPSVRCIRDCGLQVAFADQSAYARGMHRDDHEGMCTGTCMASIVLLSLQLLLGACEHRLGQRAF